MKKERDAYGIIKAWFQGGNEVSLLNDEKDKDFIKKLDQVAGLKELLSDMNIFPDKDPIVKELVLHGLAAFEVIGKDFIDNHMLFSDPLAGMLTDFD